MTARLLHGLTIVLLATLAACAPSSQQIAAVAETSTNVPTQIPTEQPQQLPATAPNPPAGHVTPPGIRANEFSEAAMDLFWKKLVFAVFTQCLPRICASVVSGCRVLCGRCGGVVR